MYSSFHSLQRLLSFFMFTSHLFFNYSLLSCCSSLYRARSLPRNSISRNVNNVTLYVKSKVLFTLKFQSEKRCGVSYHRKARYLWALSIKLLIVFINKRNYSRRQARVYFMSSSFLFRRCKTIVSCLSLKGFFSCSCTQLYKIRQGSL